MNCSEVSAAASKVRFADGRESRFFHFDDVPSRRLRPETLTREQELEQARAFARAERQGDMSMKFTADRPYSDPEKAARKLLEIANAAEAEQDGRIPIEKINAPFLFRERATPAEYSAGLAYAIEQGWLVRHESGTFVRFTQAGADLFA
jgi:hypothetical protein